MKGRHDLDAFVVLEFSAQACDAFFRVEEIFHRGVAEHDDYFGLGDGDFAQEKWLAGLRFFERRRAVLRRTAAIDVAYENIFALHADGFDDFVEKLPGATDEGTRLHIFVRARSFADEHQARFAVAFCVDDVRAPCVKRAAHAFAYIVPDVLERFIRARQRGFIFRRDFAEESGQRRWSLKLSGFLLCSISHVRLLW